MPRVTFWLGGWDPTREAVSKEVRLLQSDHPGSWIVSVAPDRKPRLDLRHRQIGIRSRRQDLAIAAMMALERLGQVSHAFNAVDAWMFLRALGSRPFLFTATWAGEPTPRDVELYARVSLFAAETDVLADGLIRSGVDARRVRVVYPGVDLDDFRPVPPPEDRPFRIVFASTPASVDEFDDRGIPLLRDAARLLPDVAFTLLWRNWGDPLAARLALERLSLPANVTVKFGDVSDMALEYQQSHAVVCAFAAGFGKSAPNSIVEGLACGRPAIVTPGVGLSTLIDRAGAGVVADRTGPAIAEAVERLRAAYPETSVRARALAESAFDERTFRRAYATFYRELASGRVAAPLPGAAPATSFIIPPERIGRAGAER